MRILIHDFAGHPFQVQLSRELVLRGHHVTHVYPVGLAGPKGRLERIASDSETFTIVPIRLSQSFRKYSPHRRMISQRKYAECLRRLIFEQAPDVVLSGNTPIDIQAELLWYCRRKRIGFVHWVQDIYCQALEFILRRRLRLLSRQISYPFRCLEKIVARRSDSTIVISPDFRSLLVEWGVPQTKVEVLENWAPLDELTPRPRQNTWSKEHGLEGHRVLLYSGTLGLKHRPDLLYRLARELQGLATVVVISEGIGREYLQKLPPLKNLLLLGFQPYDRVPDALASADVLLATLESDAGQFAVPSKILTYLSVGRAILLAGPSMNLAASVVERSGAGVVVDPNDLEAWVAAARKLILDNAYRDTYARNARQYAEQNFDIKKIGGAFEDVLLRASRALPEHTPSVYAEVVRPL